MAVAIGRSETGSSVRHSRIVVQGNQAQIQVSASCPDTQVVLSSVDFDNDYIMRNETARTQFSGTTIVSNQPCALQAPAPFIYMCRGAVSLRRQGAAIPYTVTIGQKSLNTPFS